MRMRPSQQFNWNLPGCLLRGQYALLAILVASCVGDRDEATDTRSASESVRATTLRPGFRATISGAVSGSVEGPGVLRFLPAAEVSFGTRPGYYFIADDTGVRDLGITFTIPRGTGPGTYRLESGTPFEAGETLEVRVDHSKGARTVSFSRGTEGSITLATFPASPEEMDGGPVAGRFRFSTTDASGETVIVEGSFDFEVR
jgi:hypothetical protein